MLLVARREEELERVRAAIAEHGGSASVHPCDLAEIDEVQELITAVLEQHDRVDVIVSNAGVSIRRWISESYDRFDDVQRTIATNYVGPARLVLGLLPAMREHGSGQIVSVSTIGVNFPPLRWSAYIASKAAFETWLAGVAPEVRADGVATTSIHVQLVRSPMLGPFKAWKYLPGMSTEEAAGIVARAIVARPRTVSPWWARAGGVVTALAEVPIEALLSAYVGQLGGEPSLTRKAAGAVLEAARGASAVAASRTVRPVRPDRLARVALAQRRYGATPAFLAAAAGELHPDRPGVIDELGAITFGELDWQIRAIAAALHAHFDLRPGQRVGIMCRNHRGFVLATAAATRLGCDLVPFNSDFSGPQLADVATREGVTAAVYDHEFEGAFDEADFEGARIVAWHDEDPVRPTLTTLIEAGAAASQAPPPGQHGRLITLTSGTTGTPKGATRSLSPRALAPLVLAGLFDLGRITPIPRAGEAIVLPPPLFHLFGMIGFAAGFGMGSPIVLSRRFDPEAVLEQIDSTKAGVLLAVPTMLARIVKLPDELRGRYDTSSLRMIVSGAAPLAPELATAVMDEFGEILYNGYASTEVGSGTLATPRDLRAAPGTVGRPMAGVSVKILDEEGLELPSGETGRIFVGSPLLFEGYTGGGNKQMIDGLMSTGDVGHFDGAGRLFVDGRDDDMILSGGENVFPQEVEELLATHPGVAEAAVFGVSDSDFGQRLAAMVVSAPGASVSEDELRSYVRERLARYKVPREISFVEEIPRTSTGKLQRRRLADLHSEQSA